MRDDNPFSRPIDDLLDSAARCCPSGGRETELARHGRLRLRHEIEPSNDPTPPSEVIGRELLKPVCNENGPAGPVEEHDLGGDAVAWHDDLLDQTGPRRIGGVFQHCVEGDVGSLCPQPRCAVDLCVGVGRCPIGQRWTCLMAVEGRWFITLPVRSKAMGLM